MRRVLIGCSLFLTAATSADVFNMPAGQTSLELVTIGNPNNPADTVAPSDDPTVFLGTVDYVYRIGKYDVTNAQYAEFLNAVASTQDDHQLYNYSMGWSFQQISYIIQWHSNVNNRLFYTTDPLTANNPVAWVSQQSAKRFCNWLHNGQPKTGVQDASTTEAGVYDFTNKGLTRTATAKFFLPTENEWYKAAYGSPSGIYTTYATHSNTLDSNTPPVGANFNHYPSQNSPNPFTDVGAYSSSPSAFGTFDQNGNVWQYTESLYLGNDRVIIRGGAWDWSSFPCSSSFRNLAGEFDNAQDYGFRIAAAAIPDPPRSDFNHDGTVDVKDIFAFLRDWFARK